MKLLSGHVSPDTAYVVADYPYGFTLRCQIRYWLDYKPKHGFRLVSQTTNPKRPGIVWNKPKASTYCKFGAAMYLDENEHVKWSGLSEYCSGKEASLWSETYGEAVPEIGRELFRKWVAAKLAYDAARNPDNSEDLTVGIIEAHKAFIHG